ncbi:MAG: hypothetical protein HN855_04325 [Anaerolineae bacterium]|nr:hypothetical protein [Anaerolineae bacterium]MBT7069429.1 hypothetical protein [Anaerolineae bacterium]MBT7324362.1 hypothetical protein [Anaerolineae bacterium]
MAEKTTHRTKVFKEWIPDEAREHARAARKEMRESIKSLLPPDFVKHRRKARKEMLMAWRSMIDAALEDTEK